MGKEITISLQEMIEILHRIQDLESEYNCLADQYNKLNEYASNEETRMLAHDKDHHGRSKLPGNKNQFSLPEMSHLLQKLRLLEGEVEDLKKKNHHLRASVDAMDERELACYKAARRAKIMPVMKNGLIS